MKYIQNTYSADIQIVLKQPDGRFLKNMVFARYQQDRISGQVVSDGYTEVEDADLALLQENGAFKLVNPDLYNESDMIYTFKQKQRYKLNHKS